MTAGLDPGLGVLADACEVTVSFEFFGVGVRLHVSIVDLADALWFYGEHRSDGSSSDVDVWLYAAGGFFRSLLAADGAEKTVGRQEPGRLLETRTFTDWSGFVSPIPPFGLDSARSRLLVFPAVTMSHPGTGRVLSVMGPNYTGKTTLALHLAAHGWQLISDGVSVVDIPTGAAERLHLPIGFRRESLRRRRAELAVLDTRRKISDDTGEVILARPRDMLPLVPQGAPITDLFVLDPAANAIGPAMGPPILRAFPAGAAARAVAAGVVPAGAWSVPAPADLAQVDSLARALTRITGNAARRAPC